MLRFAKKKKKKENNIRVSKKCITRTLCLCCVESRLRQLRKKKMLICLLLFSRRKRSPAASIFLLFSIIRSIIYIYYMHRSFLTKIRRTIFVAGYVYLYVCVCVYVRVNFLFSSLFKMWLKSGALIKKSRHDVAIASVPLKISQASLHPNVLPSRRKFGEDFEEEAFILHTRDASAIHDFTPTSNLRSTPRKIVTDVAR